jgi:hypothetical protein
VTRDRFTVESYSIDEEAPAAFRARISPLIKRGYDADVAAAVERALAKVEQAIVRGSRSPQAAVRRR